MVMCPDRTTCWTIFKSQEDHSKHMDWHVTKNRMAKKQRKQRPSRTWFASADMWLLASAGAAVPAFLKTQTTVGKKEKDGRLDEFPPRKIKKAPYVEMCHTRRAIRRIL